MKKKFLFVLLTAALLSCSDATTAGTGTGSEGESFVYGVTVDSLEGIDLEASVVVLSRVDWVDSDYEVTPLDTVFSDSEGTFSLLPPDTGEYMISLSWNDSLFAQLRTVTFEGDSVDLGEVGLYRAVRVSGELPLPGCAGARVWMAGFPTSAVADSSGAFVLDSVHAGRGELLAYCGDSVYSWMLVLSGACAEPSLGSLEEPSSSGNGVKRQGRQIVVDAQCNVK